MYRERARSNLKKYTACKIVSFFIALAFYVISIIIFDEWIIPEMMFAFVIAFFLNNIFYKRYIIDPIDKELNAELFHDIVTEGRLYPPSAMFQICSEYYIGAYNNTVSICKQMLDDPKLDKKFKYTYLTFLAHSYFDVGDEDALREVCERFLAELTKEPKKRKEKLKQQYTAIPFYINFINKNYDQCASALIDPDDPLSVGLLPIDSIRITYYRARVALCVGDRELAKKCFEKIIENAPHINFALLSKKGLEALEKDIEYKDTFESTCLDGDFSIARPSFFNKFAQKIRISVIVLIIIAVVARVVIVAVDQFQNSGEVDTGEQSDSLQEYKEDVRKILSLTYGDVEVIDVHWLEYDGEDVDALYVARNDKVLLIGSVFYTLENEELQYDVDMSVSFENISEPFIKSGDYFCTIDGYYMTISVCNDEEYKPEKYVYFTEVKVGETTLYIAVIDVAPFTSYTDNNT